MSSGRFTFTILGQPASKGNSRNIVLNPRTGRPMSIKSEAARSFERIARLQLPAAARRMLTGPVRVRVRIWYASMLSDLDESIVLDVLQAVYTKRDKVGNRKLVRRGVYLNDRQVWEKHVYRAGIDPTNPRVEVTVWPLDGQVELFAEEERVDAEVDSGEVAW